jgi:putative ABC transport system permease protein
MLRTTHQLTAIVGMNIRNLPARAVASAVAAIGIGGVVVVLIGVLSMSEGFRAVLQYSGRDDVAVVLRGGSNDEMSSGLSADQARIVADAPGVMSTATGALTSPELYVVIDVAARSTGTSANVPLRGAGANAAQLRQHFRITQGRMFRPGTFEVIVGTGALHQFKGIDLGTSAHWGSTTWQVVGVFEDNGSVAQGEIWTDATVLQNAYNRGTGYQSVRVRLQSAGAMASFRRALESDPRLSVRVFTERGFYAEQSRLMTTVIDTIGKYIGILMGLGALFAAVNTMYSSVAARTREIATLRALGFGALPIIASVLTEALMLGLAGGIVGSVIAYLAFNGTQTSTMNWSSFSQITFAFAVTPRLMIQGIVYGLLLALVGGLLPALRAARVPIVSGLRAL